MSRPRNCCLGGGRADSAGVGPDAESPGPRLVRTASRTRCCCVVFLAALRLFMASRVFAYFCAGCQGNSSLEIFFSAPSDIFIWTNACCPGCARPWLI